MQLAFDCECRMVRAGHRHRGGVRGRSAALRHRLVPLLRGHGQPAKLLDSLLVSLSSDRRFVAHTCVPPVANHSLADPIHPTPSLHVASNHSIPLMCVPRFSVITFTTVGLGDYTPEVTWRDGVWGDVVMGCGVGVWCQVA